MRRLVVFYQKPGKIMAQAIDHHQLLIFRAQQEIFNKLCIAYKRSNQGSAFRILAEDLRRELAISEAIFAQALESFVDANGERIVEVLERNGERYLKPGETTRSNLSD